MLQIYAFGHKRKQRRTYQASIYTYAHIKEQKKRKITHKLCCKTNFLFKILFLIEISLTNDDPK